jgi:hypothetical protein
MNWIRKIVVLIGLSIVFLAAFNADEARIDTIQTEKSTPSFSDEKIHSSVFIQPQAITAFALNSKTITTVVAKWLENFLVAIPDFKVLKYFNTFLNQDINRCEKVSLLLFPFHYFW